MMCAHIDTVPLTDRIEVELADGVYRNRREAILGADNKAAVAVLLEMAASCARRAAPVGVELVFTTSEETGLRGAKAFDMSRLQAEFGYVFDHASPIGELILAAPDLLPRGRRVHRARGATPASGPKRGAVRSTRLRKAIEAMKLGRIDDETTANVGRIEGGTATNVVAEHCRVEAEVRSLDDAKASDGRARDDRYVHMGGERAPRPTSTLTVEEQFRAYRIGPERALRGRCRGGAARLRRRAGPHVDRRRQRRERVPGEGVPLPQHRQRHEANHTPDESVTVAALEKMLDIDRCECWCARGGLRC